MAAPLRLAENGRQPKDATLVEMDTLWEEAKALPRETPPTGAR